MSPCGRAPWVLRFSGPGCTALATTSAALWIVERRASPAEPAQRKRRHQQERQGWGQHPSSPTHLWPHSPGWDRCSPLRNREVRQAAGRRSLLRPPKILLENLAYFATVKLRHSGPGHSAYSSSGQGILEGLPCEVSVPDQHQRSTARPSAGRAPFPVSSPQKELPN